MKVKVVANTPELVKRLRSLGGESSEENLKIEILSKENPNVPVQTVTAKVVIPAIPNPADSEDTAAARGAGKTKVNPKDGLRYVWIPPGTFIMGCSSGDTECGHLEKPAHQVTITKGFWMGQMEVTQAAYERVIGKNPSSHQGLNLPVESVRWTEVDGFCKAVGMRLPTEAEWEYAARGGNPSSRYGNLDDIAWYGKNSGDKTHEVGQKKPNSFGLYDMLGNVWEWTADWDGGYPAGARKDPRGPTSGQYRTLRGGSWYENAVVIRASFRSGAVETSLHPTYGVRCAGE